MLRDSLCNRYASLPSFIFRRTTVMKDKGTFILKESTFLELQELVGIPIGASWQPNWLRKQRLNGPMKALYGLWSHFIIGPSPCATAKIQRNLSNHYPQLERLVYVLPTLQSLAGGQHYRVPCGINFSARTNFHPLWNPFGDFVHFSKSVRDAAVT